MATSTPLNNLNPQNPAAFTKVLGHLKSNPQKIEEYLTTNWKDFPPKNAHDVEDLLHFCLSIIAGEMEPDQYFKKLQQEGVLKSSVCGFVWQGGDTAYKCKTCQIDSSCALCTACFQAGSHEGHDYSLQKIGGGFCDCGDPHSWKATAFCPNHKPVEGSILDQINSFPEYLVTASHAVFRAVLFRLQDLLSSGSLYADDKEPTAIVAWLDKIIRFGDFFRAVLIKELIKIDNAKGEVAEGKGESFLTRLTALDNVNIPPPLAMELHTLYFHLLIIPEFKRPFLISHFLPHYAKNIDEHAKGYRERDMFSDFTVQLFTAPPLIDVLLENKTFEMILDKLYNMLAKALVDRKPVPRAARKKLQAAAEAEKAEETNTEATTTEETTEKKEEAEEGGNKRKGKRKKEDETIEDKENNNNNNLPPPAPVAPPHLIPNPIPQYSKVLSARKPAIYQSLYVIFTTDLGYLLVHQILSQKVFEDPTLSTLDLWLAVIGLVQGMNGNTVTLKTHYDPERWICSFRCELDMLGTLRPLLPSLPQTAAQMEKVVARVARSLGGWMLGWGLDQHMDNPIFFGILSQIIKGEIPHLALTPEGFKPYVESVSFHLPIHRVLASFLRESLPLFGDSNNNNASVGGIEGLISRVSQLGTDVTAKQIAAYTLYHPLRLAAMIAQIRAGLWRSGGGEEEVWGQSVTYTSVHFQKYYDLDLFLIQVCSALLGANEFHMLATQVFGLLSWFRLDSKPATEKPTNLSTPAPPSTPSTSSSSSASTATPAPPSTPGGQSTNKDVPSTPFTPAPAATADAPAKEEPVANISYGSGFAATDEQNTVLAEDLLHFLITAARERMLSGFSEQQKIRREIIHRLVLGDVTHSQLVGNIQKQLVDHADFEPILKEVAIFQKPQKMDQGKYHLKDECWAEYDPYFPHYTRQELQAADEKVNDFRNKSAPKTPTTPSKSSSSSSASAATRSYAPSVPQTPYPALSNLGTLLHSRFLHQLIFTVLFNVTNSSALVTDAMLTHIFVVGIPENDKDYQNSATTAPEIPDLTINIDFPSANNLLRNAGHEVNISNIRDSTSGSTKTSIVQLLVKLQYLPTTPAEQKEIISRILKKMADADSKLRDQIEVHTSAYVFASKGKRDKEDEDEKKRKARARQAAILQQMKSRQSAFESQLLMADDDDDMDDMGEGAAKAVIPTNTTSDGEVVSSTCALCREGGNLTARPLGHVAFVQRSVVLALSKWGPEVRRARIESAIAPHAHAHAHASGAQGDASASGAPGPQEGASGERMEISEPPTPASPRHNPRIMFAGEEMEYEDEFETDDEEEADFPGSEADDDDDETAKALRYMYNIAHGVPAEQGMAPPAEIPQHFPQFHPQSDEGDEDDEDEDDEDDSDEELFDSDDELVIDGGMGIDGEEGEDDEDDDEDDDHEPGPWDSDDDQQLDKIMKDIVDDLAGVPNEDDEDEDDEMNDDDEIKLVVVDKKKEGEGEGEKKPAEGGNNNNNESGEWVAIPGLAGPRMQVHREGDGLFEVRVRMDPEWISQHGGGASAASAAAPPMIVEDEEDDDDGEIPPLDLWAPTDKVDTSKPAPQNKVALGRNFSSLETFRDLEGSVGTHLTFCGHVIHHDCFNNYFSALIRSHFQDNAYEGEDLIVLEKGEFLCPLCRRIGNCLIPIVPDSTFTFPKASSPSVAGADLEPLLQGLHEFLNPVNVESNNSNTAPTPPNNFDTAVEQVANRVYCVQHSVGFESLTPSTNTGPNLVAALASAVACNELAQRNNESRALVGTSTQRSDLRAFYRSCVTRLSSHPLPAYDSKCSWNMIAGLPVPPLPLPDPPTTTEPTTKTTTTTTTPESTTTATSTTTPTPAVSADNKNESTTTTTTTTTTTATTTQELHFPPLLGTDLFHLAVQLSLHIPFDTSKFLDIVRILFDAEILQILLHYKLSIMVPEAKTQPFAGDSTVYPPPPAPTPAIPKNDSFYSLVLSFFDSCTAALPPSSYSSPLASSSLASPSPASPSFIPLPDDHAARTKALALPFLRRCALFFHTCLFGAHPPAITNDEFDNLSDFLHLPKLEIVVDGILRHQNSLAAKWVAQYASSVRLIDESLPVNILSVSAVSPPLPPSLIPHHAPAHPFRLISLPTSYQAVYQYCTTTPCRVCGQVSSTPGLCLVCGCIVCLGTPCCRDGLDRGEGSVHSATCSVATPFLVAKSTAVLLLRGERHAFWGSPYLDEHGEEDSHLRRGKPLYLNPSRYEQLAYMVGACQLESDSKVIESSSLVDAEWY